MADFVHIERLTLEDAPANSTTSQVMGPPKSDLEFLDLHPFIRQNVLDKVYGCLLGSALGDTIGLYTEFLPKKACESIYKDRKFSLVEPVTEWYSDTHRSKSHQLLNRSGSS